MLLFVFIVIRSPARTCGIRLKRPEIVALSGLDCAVNRAIIRRQAIAVKAVENGDHNICRGFVQVIVYLEAVDDYIADYFGRGHGGEVRRSNILFCGVI